MSAAVWIAAALLGGCGAVARVLAEHAIARRWRRAFPVSRLAVNVSGSLLLGLLAGAGVAGDALFLGGTATLGSLTTFSGWMAETERLADRHLQRIAAANIAVGLLAGLAALLLGRALGDLL